MAKSRGFRELLVWQKATDLVVDVYKTTRAFPSDERFGLTSQMRRAAVSIVANIAEGSARATAGEFANCLSISRGSLKELEALVEVCVSTGFPERGRLVGAFAQSH
jgi:four helix bundle protein